MFTRRAAALLIAGSMVFATACSDSGGAEGSIGTVQAPGTSASITTDSGDTASRIEAIAQKMYGAASVSFSETAQKKIDTYTKQGYGNLPICIAKTQYSLSHDAALKGAPTGFEIPIRDVRMAAGAGYLYALAADIQTIPGLPTAPGYMNVDVDLETGEIQGLF